MRFAIIGAGGFSREVVDLVVALGHDVCAVFDEYVEGTHEPTGLIVRNTLGDLDCEAIAPAIGDALCRGRLIDELAGRYAVPFLVHPTAVVSEHAHLGRGCLVMQCAVVNSGARIGDGSIVNVGACVAHDCAVGRYAHIAPGVQMGGGSRVGNFVLCGTNCVVLPGILVGDEAVIGAGSVVTRDVAPGSTVVGAPARPLRAIP